MINNCHQTLPWNIFLRLPISICYFPRWYDLLSLEIRRFLSLSTLFTFLTAPVSVQPYFDSVVHQQEIKEEYERLESVYDDRTSYWVPWAKHHAGKHQSVVWIPDISAIVPPFDESVHTLDMQYDCMNIISNIINTLNPGQIPVDTANQPIFALTKELIIQFPANFVLINTSVYLDPFT